MDCLLNHIFFNKLTGNINFSEQVRGKEEVMLVKMKEKIRQYPHEIKSTQGVFMPFMYF